MDCKICKTENPSNSLFCLECGAFINNGKGRPIKDEDRMVSAKEFKDRIYGLEIPKGVQSRQINEFVKSEMEKWRADPWYMPMIGAPMKINDTPKAMQFTPLPESDIMIDDDGNCTHDKDFECGLKKNCNLPLGSEYKSLVNVEDRLRSMIPNVPNVNHIYGEPTFDLDKCFCGTADQKYVYNHRSEEPHMCANCQWINKNHPTYTDDMRKENVEMLKTLTSALDIPLASKTVPYKKGGFRAIGNKSIQCGVCGTTNCREDHIPPIQQQYQEAFENIQRFRRNRLERWKYEQELKELQIKVAEALMPPPLYRPFPIFEMRKGWDRKKVDIPEELIHLENRNKSPDGDSITRKPSLARKPTKTRRLDGKPPMQEPAELTSVQKRRGKKPSKMRI